MLPLIQRVMFHPLRRKSRIQTIQRVTTTGWQDSADYDIGDDVPFKLEGTVAANYAQYKQYYFAFHDKEEEGLTFNKDSVRVYVDNTEIKEGYTVVDNPADGCTFEVVFNDLMAAAKEYKFTVNGGSKIRVEYTSKLNEKAKIGKEGNVNSASLEFPTILNQEQGELLTLARHRGIMLSYLHTR